jgi:hypothetical protein
MLHKIEQIGVHLLDRVHQHRSHPDKPRQNKRDKAERQR